MRSIQRLFFLLTFVLPIFWATQLLAKHPVQQLAEWEILANPALSQGDFDDYALKTILMDGRLTAEEEMAVLQATGLKTLQELRNNPKEIYRSIHKIHPDLRRSMATRPFRLDFLEIAEDEFKAKMKTLGNYGINLHHDLLSEKQSQLIRFKKDGKYFIRWPIHPLNEQKDPILKIFPHLKIQRGPLWSHFTASRSLFVFDGENYSSAVSVKVGVKRAAGPFSDKSIHMKEVKGWVGVNEYIHGQQKIEQLEHSKLLQEPMIYAISTQYGEEGLVVRTLSEAAEGQHYYLPAFAIFDEKVGVEIAKLNGSDNPFEYWREHLIHPMAKADAELKAKAGITHTSPHSQNYLVELDANMKPTGRIIIRDTDIYVDEDFLKSSKRRIRPEFYQSLINDQGELAHRYKYILNNGIEKNPPWLSKKQSQSWGLEYINAFQEQYKKITGISLAEISSTDSMLGDLLMFKINPDKFKVAKKKWIENLEAEERGDCPPYPLSYIFFQIDQLFKKVLN